MTISGCGGGQGAAVGLAAPASMPVETAPLVTSAESFQPAPMQAKSAPTNLSAGERPPASGVRLPQLAAARRAELGRAQGGPGVAARIGSAREVPDTFDAAAMARTLKWHQRPGRGHAAAISFTSEGAAGLRVGLLVRKLPADAVIRGYARGAGTAFEIPGRTVLETLRRNRDAGDLSEEGRTYWTPVVQGEELTVEIVLPPGASGDAVDIAVPRLSHLHVKADDFGTLKIGEAASCNVDVSCVNEPNTSQSTARMLFTSGGTTFLCTGTLVNDSISSGTPYFLSASHCISNQSAASSLNTYWFYRSTACNVLQLNPGYRRLNLGATLLYTSTTTDTSFMRLNEPAPAGAVFSGWRVDAPSIGEAVIGIHHPWGDLQKYNEGSVSGFGSCSPGWEPGTFSCAPTSQSGGNFVMSTWSRGTTEAGSSGSGLFSTLGGSRYLIGQLYGGSASCSFNGADAYGRLDTAYFAGLSRWLSPPVAPATPRSAIYRFYNATTGAHFFTMNTQERDWLTSGPSPFKYEGVAFYAYASAVAGASPVYRFYNTLTGRHFYTISDAERDNVLALMPYYRYEGIGWYAQATSGGTAAAVYRLYNAALATHFYTTSEFERDWAQPSYQYEGVGYYAWSTQ
ncbi:MAG: serine protease [Ramlibacter sp.]|nr:serine protease [Ramlibacter sp.]